MAESLVIEPHEVHAANYEHRSPEKITILDSQYHIQLLTETLGNYFSPPALDQIIAANLGQDELRYQLGAYPHYHFDNNEIARSLAYVDEEQARIGELATTAAVTADTSAAQRAALGRLTHA